VQFWVRLMKPFEEILSNLPDAQREAIEHRFVKIGRKLEKCPHIFVLIGAPASGKSTWTTAYLETARPTTVASTDQQIDAYAAANGLSYSEAHDKIDMESLEQNMQGSIRVAVAKSQDIIIDRTNLRVKSRNRWLSQVPRHYVRIGVVFTVEPVEALFKRLHKRAKETGKYVPDLVVQEMLSSYQPPTLDEFDIILLGNEE
jgi:predicted kinase